MVTPGTGKGIKFYNHSSCCEARLVLRWLFCLVLCRGRQANGGLRNSKGVAMILGRKLFPFLRAFEKEKGLGLIGVASGRNINLQNDTVRDEVNFE